MSQKYDPSKKYSWTPQDQFVLSGDQFGNILNGVRAIMGSPEALKIMAISKANDVIESIMVNAVEEGIVLEMPEPNEGMSGNLKILK